MSSNYESLLNRLDTVGLNRYQIFEQDIETVERYLKLIQANLMGVSTWDELVEYGGPYGTSILIHEIVEIRFLRAKGLSPLQQRTRALQRLLSENVEAHITAIYEEHLYLQEVIQRLYGQTFQVGTLLNANRNDDMDIQLFLESDIGIYLLEETRVETARQMIDQLKGG